MKFSITHFCCKHEKNHKGILNFLSSVICLLTWIHNVSTKLHFLQTSSILNDQSLFFLPICHQFQILKQMFIKLVHSMIKRKNSLVTNNIIEAALPLFAWFPPRERTIGMLAAMILVR